MNKFRGNEEDESQIEIARAFEAPGKPYLNRYVYRPPERHLTEYLALKGDDHGSRGQFSPFMSDHQLRINCFV